MNVTKFAKEIFAAEVPPVDQKKQPPKPEAPVTSVPQNQIDFALELAGSLKEKISSLASEIDLAMENLSGTSSPSVLESKDDFKSLVLRLKQMKRKLMVV